MEREIVTISELKKSPAKVLDRAEQTGTPVSIVRNNQVAGFFVPVSALRLIDASDADVAQSVDTVLENYGDVLTWLASN